MKKLSITKVTNNVWKFAKWVSEVSKVRQLQAKVQYNTFGDKTDEIDRQLWILGLFSDWREGFDVKRIIQFEHIMIKQLGGACKCL